jgi:methionyl-tRNA formyltransferase
MRKLRIVFMGTPEFAVPMLATIQASNHTLAGIVTAPDKPAGRGMQLTQSEVKKAALALNVPILQPEKLKSEIFISELRALQADLFVVVAFRMLPEIVWNMPPLGTINLHASLLPQYRGAAPINWAIINGEKKTGVTTFFLQHEIDTGKIIFQESLPIGENETVGELYQRLMQLGSTVVRKTIDAIAAGNYPQTPQDHITDIKHAPKIFKETCKINWQQTTSAIHNFIRGLSPYPVAFTEVGGKVFKIFNAKPIVGNIDAPGKISTDGKTYFHIHSIDGAIAVLECQLEGKKRLSVEEFLRGFNVASIQ